MARIRRDVLDFQNTVWFFRNNAFRFNPIVIKNVHLPPIKITIDHILLFISEKQ